MLPILADLKAITANHLIARDAEGADVPQKGLGQRFELVEAEKLEVVQIIQIPASLRESYFIAAEIAGGYQLFGLIGRLGRHLQIAPVKRFQRHVRTDLVQPDQLEACGALGVETFQKIEILKRHFFQDNAVGAGQSAEEGGVSDRIVQIAAVVDPVERLAAGNGGKIVDQAAIVDRQPLERLQVLQRGDVPKLRELIQVQRFQLDGVREEGKIRNGNTVIQREGGQTDSSLIDPLRSGRTPASMQTK